MRCWAFFFLKSPGGLSVCAALMATAVSHETQLLDFVFSACFCGSALRVARLDRLFLQKNNDNNQNQVWSKTQSHRNQLQIDPKHTSL